MQILSKYKRATYDGLPRFDRLARSMFFNLDNDIRRHVSRMHNPENKVGFLLQCGYFKAKGRFFPSTAYKKQDITYCKRLLGIKEALDLTHYLDNGGRQHQSKILQLCGWRKMDPQDKEVLRAQAERGAALQEPLERIFYDLLDWCWLHQVEIPKRHVFQEMVQECHDAFTQSLHERIANNATDDHRHCVTELLSAPSIVNSFTELKHIPQGDTQKSLVRAAEQLVYFRDLHQQLHPVLAGLQLTDNAIRQFSSEAVRAGARGLRSLKNDSERLLKITAFVQDQYFQRQDFAADAFNKVITSLLNLARNFERDQRARAAEHNLESNRSVLSHSRDAMALIEVLNHTLSDAQKTENERNEIARHLIESFMEAQTPDLITHHQRQETVIDQLKNRVDFYDLLFTKHLSLQNSLGPLLKALSFDEQHSNKRILAAIKHYQQGMVALDDSAPLGFLSAEQKRLLEEEHPVPAISRYKVMLLVNVRDSLKSRELVLSHSYRRRDIKSSWIPDPLWKREKTQLLNQASMDQYSDVHAILKARGKSVTRLFEQVNESISLGQNPDLKITSNGGWSIRNAEPDYSIVKYIPNLLDQKKAQPLYEMIRDVDHYANVLDRFTPHTSKHTKKDIDKNLLCAAIMAVGTNLGNKEMAKACRNFTEKQLGDTYINWLTEDNLIKANETLVKTIQSLSLPSIYRNQNGVLHTSSDGKKLVVDVDSLLANYSYKYYGREQGVSVNSFVDDRQSFFHVNILKSSDREAPYMIDGLAKTKATLFNDEDEHRHSTDTHGYTEATFTALNFLGVAFSPRIKNVHKQKLYYYESKTNKRKSGYAVKPGRGISHKKIIENWDDILRLMVSIKLGYCPGSDTFKTLSASTRETKLYAAVKEFGRLLKTEFILTYIDDADLRRSINKQLNIVELGQKLSEAMFFARGGELKVGVEPKITITQLCLTFLKNVIILWNYLFLSEHYLNTEDDQEQAAILEGVKEGSVIAWAHVNKLGIYDFDQPATPSFSRTLQEFQDVNVKLDKLPS